MTAATPISVQAGDTVDTLVKGSERHHEISVLASVVEARDMEHLLSLLDRVRDRLHPAVVALGAELEGKGTLVVAVSAGVEKLNAGQLVKDAAREFGGGGGGTAMLGRGGGGDPIRLPEAIAAAKAAIIAGLEE